MNNFFLSKKNLAVKKVTFHNHIYILFLICFIFNHGIAGISATLNPARFGTSFDSDKNTCRYLCNNAIDNIQLNYNASIDCPQADIIISTNTPPWSNLVIEMCPDQKIIIQSGATLSLNACQIKSKNNGEEWDGIYLEGNASISISGHSVIKNSVNGITGQLGYKSIRIVSSELTDNGRAIHATGTGNLAVLGITIINSDITTSSNSQQENCITADNTNISLIGVTIFNKGIVKTGISGFGNSMNIDRCTIKNFPTGIFKGSGGSMTSTALNIRESDILNCSFSLYHTGFGITATRNIFSGIVVNDGKCLGKWRWNNFIGSNFMMLNPQTSQIIEENKIAGSLTLYRDEYSTSATCNTWTTSTGTAVQGNATRIIRRWQGQSGESSGNSRYHENAKMSVTANNIITLYCKNSGEESFLIGGKFEKKFVGPAFCYNNWREAPPFFYDPDSTETYNEVDNNNMWIQYHDEYTEIVNSIQGITLSSDSDTLYQLENLQAKMGQCLLKAISNSDTGTSQTIISRWVGRSDSLLIYRSNYIPLFALDSFQSVGQYLNGLVISDAYETNDKNIFKNAIDWMKSAKDSSKNLKDLDSFDLNILIEIGSSSFGNFTETLRSWLMLNYNIMILPPLDQEQLKRQILPEAQTKLNSIGYIINQEDCIFIKENRLAGSFVIINIISLDGHIVYNEKMNFDEIHCIKANLMQGFYIIKITDTNKGINSLIPLMVK
ncbi:MAG: hypothetical protein ABIO44_00640 [Saprospiraceae bacterium]